MKFINTLANTVRLADIETLIPYQGEEPQELSPDLVHRSQSFQSLILDKKFTIVEASNDRIEQNLLKTVQGEAYGPPIVTEAEVVVRGNFHAHTGYAKSNRNLVYSLAGLGVNIAIDPVNPSNEGLNEAELQPLNLLNHPWSDRAIQIHSAIPSFAETSYFRYRILNTTVECASIPKQFVDACNSYDEVWTVSDFCKDVFEQHGIIKPITVIPNAVDTALYNDKVKPTKILPQLKSFIFISVFGWNWRKGYDVLLKAYLQEFTGKDNVSLLLVVRYQYDNNRRRTYKIENEIKSFIRHYGGDNPPQVVRCGRLIPEIEMPRLYRACNAFVLPTRGDGFCLPNCEASLCGLPVITTAYGGAMMYLNEENSFLLRPDSISPENSEQAGVHFWHGQSFVQLINNKTIKELGCLMRQVYENPTEAQYRNNLLKTAVANVYNCTTVAKLAEERIDTIWKNL